MQAARAALCDTGLKAAKGNDRRYHPRSSEQAGASRFVLSAVNLVVLGPMTVHPALARPHSVWIELRTGVTECHTGLVPKHDMRHLQ